MKTTNDKFLFDTPGWSIGSTAPTRPTTFKGHKKPKRKRTECATTETDSGRANDEQVPVQSKKMSLSKKQLREILSQNLPTETAPTPAGPQTSDILSTKLLDPKLIGSKFRILNESLYKSTGPEALELFHPPNGAADGDSGHELSDAYHQGFRQQTQSWPQNPVEVLIRAIQKDAHRLGRTPLSVSIADLGCGEALMAKRLCGPRAGRSERLSGEQKASSSVDFRVFSFDLVSDLNGWIVQAECSTLVPLPGSHSDLDANCAMMDVVVCCLSLMNTTWVGMILEARRILRMGGQLKLAEVTSRFVNLDCFIRFIKSIGFALLNQDQSNSHFTLVTFEKTCKASTSDNRDSTVRQSLIKQGPKLLKPCCYKRR